MVCWIGIQVNETTTTIVTVLDSDHTVIDISSGPTKTPVQTLDVIVDTVHEALLDPHADSDPNSAISFFMGDPEFHKELVEAGHECLLVGTRQIDDPELDRNVIIAESTPEDLSDQELKFAQMTATTALIYRRERQS